MAASTIAAIGSLALGAFTATRKPDEPDAPKVPPIDPEEMKARARRRSMAARARAGGFGVQSTFQTGPGGLSPPVVPGKGTKKLLGE